MSKPNEPKTQTVSDALKHAIEKFPTTPIAEVTVVDRAVRRDEDDLAPLERGIDARPTRSHSYVRL